MDNFARNSDVFTAVSLDSKDPSVADGEPILVDAEYWTWGSSSSGQSGFCVVV